MKLFQFVIAFIVFIAPAFAFFSHVSVARRSVLSMSTSTEDKQIVSIEAPDFYWKFRLDRLVSKKTGELSFDPKNYPESTGYQSLYDSYYLDLAINGKLGGFNWVAEKEINDAEWLEIYNNISKWTQTTAKASKPDTTSLPANDFDLLKQFYPQLNYRELDTPFIAAEVGEGFPYPNLKSLLSAAAAGKLNIPGFAAPAGTALEASESRALLATLKEQSLAKIEEIYADTMKYANTPFPDEQARKHYQALRSKLADFPQNPAGWAAQRASLEKDVDEMARLAAKKEDEHHHHEEGDDEHLSPAQEFEQKYGLNLDELQETFNRFKSNPDSFLENSIIEKFGRNGLDIWKKSQEFSERFNTLSPAERAKEEAEFVDFLKQA